MSTLGSLCQSRNGESLKAFSETDIELVLFFPSLGISLLCHGLRRKQVIVVNTCTIHSVLGRAWEGVAAEMLFSRFQSRQVMVI